MIMLLSCKLWGPAFKSQLHPCGTAGKESTCDAGDLGLIPGLGRSPEEGKDYPLQYSGLENSLDCMVHGIIKSQTWLSDFHFHFPLNKCDLGQTVDLFGLPPSYLWNGMKIFASLMSKSRWVGRYWANTQMYPKGVSSVVSDSLQPYGL